MQVCLTRSSNGNVLKAVTITQIKRDMYEIVRMRLNDHFGTIAGQYMHDRLLASRIGNQSFMVSYKSCPTIDNQSQAEIDDAVASVFGDMMDEKQLQMLKSHKLDSFYA